METFIDFGLAVIGFAAAAFIVISVLSVLLGLLSVFWDWLSGVSERNFWDGPND